MKFAIVGGKTGGHLYPAIALAQQLTDSGHEVMFICSEAVLDREVLSQMPWPYYPLPSLSPRKGLWAWFKVTQCAFSQARSLLKNNCINGVIGTGGFVAVAPCLAAKTMRLPMVLIEPNAVPGKANRFLANFANKVCLSFEGAIKFWPKRLRKKLVVTGTPVRKEFHDISMVTDQLLVSEKPTFLIMGGSQGATSLNQVAVRLVERFADVQWIHLTGHKDFGWVNDFYDQHAMTHVEVYPFYDRMEQLFLRADYVIARAGAVTIAELKALQKEAVLIPLKNSADNHQYHNAMAAESEGWAKCCVDTPQLYENLVEHLEAVCLEMLIDTQ